MSAKEPILEVNLGPHNGILKFLSVEEIHNFFQTERQAWTWANSSPLRQSISAPGTTISNSLNQIQAALQHLTPDNLKPLPTVKAAIEQAFNAIRIPLSDSRVGQFIGDLKAESPTSGAAALATWMNLSGVNFSNFDHLKGAMLMAAFDANITSRTPSSVKRSLEQLHQNLRDAKTKTEQETTEQRSAFAQAKGFHRSATAKMIRQGRRQIRDFRDTERQNVDQLLTEVHQKTETAISDLRATEILYKEHMRLKGPVEYWSAKATEHRKSARAYRLALLWFSGVASVGLVIALSVIASHAIEIATKDKPPAVYLVLVTLGVVMSTIIFWAARILTRLFLSEHHLAIDADERAIMTQTYLALTAEGQATENERSIVLGSLFRPTADGIVKDDAAPDFSPASLLSRLTAR
ncbi:hypothetical protein CN167_29365 [Sinorhizobium medicae]|uniref:DUF6161 domain-containing protein n=1 Tax=Sinorhizobium medicae TaxID=110321 RepID=UPI000FD9E96F|nr:DUF6161 domain-containing protein [Sinorhizobium medicae]RVJ68176.1 hypothetical protein CN167_29365 [Sinorhizobium medicae]